MNFLYRLLAFVTLLVPYLLWGWKALVVVLVLAVAFHVGWRVKTGKWMEPL